MILMILDRLERRSLYQGMGLGIPKALDYLARTDFESMAPGKYEIDGDRLFAVVQHSQLKPLSEIAWEMHRKYVDVQYLGRGDERMGFVPFSNSLPVTTPYDDQKDYMLFKADGPLLYVPAGSFAVFTPDEVHAPSLAPNDDDPPGQVLKVVVKCLWEK
jgi:YhcH/YjgK/YiaL family protein